MQMPVISILEDDSKARMGLELVQGKLLGGRFKVLASLGSGDVGSVFLASDSSRGDDLVVLHTFTDLEHESQRRMLMAACSNYRAIHHPGLVPILDVVDQAGLQAVCTAYSSAFTGDTLPSHMPASCMQVLRALMCLTSACIELQARGLSVAAFHPEKVQIFEDGTAALDRWWNQAPGLTINRAEGAVDSLSSIKAFGRKLLARMRRLEGDPSQQAAHAALHAVLTASPKGGAHSPIDQAKAFYYELTAVREYLQSKILCSARVFLAAMSFYLFMLLIPMVSGSIVP